VSERTYYGLLFRLGGQLGWLLWFSNDVDGLDLVDGRFPVFPSATALADAARHRGIEIAVEEPNLHDLDMIASWLSRPRYDSLDAGTFLAGWNFFADVASSLERPLDDRTDPYLKLYEKLFLWGGPAWVTRRDEQGHATWTPEEVALLVDLLGRGLEMFSTRMTRV
jgi:hypothetical protein